MELDYYIKNLNTFISVLPESDVMFLYFVVKQRRVTPVEYVPHINTSAKKWDMDGTVPLYIIRGGQGYCYIYKESAIKYSVQLDKGKVSGFDREESKYGTLGGSGAIINDVNLGNHLTIGVSVSKATGKYLLETHLTTYIPDTKNPANSQRDALECNVFLTDTIDKTCDCIQMGKPRGLKLRMYDEEDIAIVPAIKALHRYIWNGVAMGGKKKRGTNTKIHTGPKGGKYKLIKGRRVYVGGNGGIKDSLTGGFVPSFVTFVKEVLLDTIASYRPNMEEAIVVDDGSEQIMFRYIFNTHGFDTSNVFMIERGTVIAAWRAYSKPPAARTAEDNKAMDTITSAVEGFRAEIMVSA
jgi:hypothetical protein